MKKNTKLFAKIFAAIFALAAMCAALTACAVIDENGDNNGGGNKVGLSAAEWQTLIETFIEETGGTDEVDVIVGNLSAFAYADGKYTANMLTLGNGFTMRNIVIETENGAIKKITYELRTEALDTPDRIVTIDADGVTHEDVPKPSDSDKMEEDEWTEQTEIFANVTNYTLARTRGGALVGAMKLDGFKYYDIAGDYERVFTTDGTKYYRYGKATDESVWTRREVGASSYEAAVAEPAFMVGMAAEVISSGFGEFAFDKGVYTTDELVITAYDITLRNIKVTISGKAIVKVICTYVGGYDNKGDELITVDHVGSTAVDIPTNYTEAQDPGPQPPSPDNGKLTADEWTAAVNTLSGSTNFTTIGQAAYSGSINRISGDTIYTAHLGGDHSHETEYAGTVYTKEGESYVKWIQQKPTDAWVRTAIEKAEYDSQFENAAESTAMIAGVLIDNYDLFSYNFGLYSADKEIDVGASTYVTDLAVLVEKKQITSVAFTIMYRVSGGNDKNMGTNIISDIGSTVAFDPGDIGSVSGKLSFAAACIPLTASIPTTKSKTMHWTLSGAKTKDRR